MIKIEAVRNGYLISREREEPIFAVGTAQSYETRLVKEAYVANDFRELVMRLESLLPVVEYDEEEHG